MIIGLVGKASSGKSTFFKAATLAEVAIASYPFTTIDANFGVGYVRVECADKDLNVQCNPKFGYCIKHTRFVPIQLIDVAGLVLDAHKGKGRGNQFLDDLRQADVLIHIVDASGSTDENGNPVKKLSHDPIKDIRFLEYELDMWYLGILKKGWDKFARTVHSANLNIKSQLAKQLSGLGIDENMVEHSIRKFKLSHDPVSWKEDELMQLASELRRMSKPIIIAANKMDIEGSDYNLHMIQEICKDYLIIPCSGDSEVALREAAKHKLIQYLPGDNNFEVIGSLNDAQKNALNYIRKKVLEKYGSTGIQDILDRAVFEFLRYIAIFPGGINKLSDKEGRILPDCFLLKEGTTAYDFAAKIHSDLAKHFIKAINVRTKLAVGKDYKLKHRDVLEIVTSK